MDHGLDDRAPHHDRPACASRRSSTSRSSRTNDLHYTHQHDAKSHAALLCVQSGSTLDDPKRFKFDGEEYYLKTPAQMRQIFRDHPEACDNTLAIAERATSHFDTSANYMPRFPVPAGETEQSWFVKEVERGLHVPLSRPGSPTRCARRAEYETDVIVQMGFPGYFLVVADFINWAKENGIRVGPGRGSGAGSMAAYAMRITDLDPLQHGLLFERFLNPDRVSMPDFDIDFDDRRRGEVIQYVTEKYGDERVAQIVTYGTIKAKQALKDAGRVLGFPFSMGERLTKAMPPAVMGKDMPLEGMFDKDHPRFKEASEFRALIETDAEAKTVFDTAVGLENLKRQWGVHAAGVIMSSEPLIDIIPIMKREQDGQIVTQFDYPACESLGLIKMDFLGLRNLTIIDDALDNIAANRGEKLVLEDLALDDAASYELLARGDTLGVFQLDGGPMRSLLRLDEARQLRRHLGRPRAVPSGPDGRELAHQLRAPQERAAGDRADPPRARRAARRRPRHHLRPDRLPGAGHGGGAEARRLHARPGRHPAPRDGQEEEVRARQAAGGLLRRHDGERVQPGRRSRRCGRCSSPFADYAFNKAHTAAYGLIAYWTAYLKAHYPAEYMAALLTSVGDAKDKLAVYLNECRRMGIKVLPPDVGESIRYFAAVGEDIRFGLGAVRNVGANVVDAIVARAAGRAVRVVPRLPRARCPMHVANKRTVESLIKAGAFDSLGSTRRALMEIHEDATEAAVEVKRKAATGAIGFDFDSLYDETEEPLPAKVPDRPEWTKKDKLAFEREMLGLYVSDHPLAGLEIPLAKHASISIHDLLASEDLSDGDQVTVAGLVTSVQHRVAKSSGNPYGMITVEDFDGEVTVMFMGKTYTEFQSMLQRRLRSSSCAGAISRRDDGLNLHAQSAFTPDLGAMDAVGPLVLVMPERRASEATIEELLQTLQRHGGDTEVTIKLHSGRSAKVFEVPHPVRVTADLYGELKGLLGPQCLG